MFTFAYAFCERLRLLAGGVFVVVVVVLWMPRLHTTLCV